MQSSIQKYVSITQKLSNDYYRDEENGLLESKEEQELSSMIENDLKKVSFLVFACKWPTTALQLAEAIDLLRTIRNAGNSGKNQESVIKRFFEIHSDYCCEYKNNYVCALE